LNLGADDNSVVDEMMSSTGSLSAGIAYDTEIPKMELLKVVDANVVKNQNNLDKIYREQAEQAAAAARSNTETIAQRTLRLKAGDAAIENAKKGTPDQVGKRHSRNHAAEETTSEIKLDH
jgi:hypothetical protein